MDNIDVVIDATQHGIKEFDYFEQYSWVNDMFGKAGNRWNYDLGVYHFATAEDATIFLLKWPGKVTSR